MKSISTIPLFLFFIAWMSTFHLQAAPGIYAYVDVRGEADSSAKIREFTSGRKVGGDYLFRIKSGREIKVKSSEFKGFVYYPPLRLSNSLEKSKKQAASLRAFSQRFPASRRYITQKQTRLLRHIYNLENNIKPKVAKAPVKIKPPEKKEPELAPVVNTPRDLPVKKVQAQSKIPAASEIFENEIRRMVSTLSSAMQATDKKKIAFARIFFNGGTPTSASAYLKRKIAMGLLNSPQIELFDRDDIVATFEENKLSFSLKGESIPELSSTDVLLTGEIIALNGKNGVGLSLRLINLATGELLAAPVAILPTTQALASRMKRNKIDPLATQMTKLTPGNKNWLQALKAKLPSKDSRVAFSDLPDCSDSEKLQLRFARSLLLSDLKSAGIKVLEREFLYLLGGDPLASNLPLNNFLKGEYLFSVVPESDGKGDNFPCLARLTNSSGRLLSVAEFKFDYVAKATESGSLADASLEDALRSIEKNAKANDKSKLIYTRTWSLANGCQITKDDWEKFENVADRTSRSILKIMESPFGSGDDIYLGSEDFQSTQNLNWSTTCREMIRRLALAQKSDVQSVKYTVITGIIGGFSLRGDHDDEGPWKDSNFLGLWCLLLSDAFNDWTAQSSGSVEDRGALKEDFTRGWGQSSFPQKLLSSRVSTMRYRKDDKLSLPKGSYTLEDSDVPIKLNYEITWKWKGLLPSEVTMTIDLTPSKNLLYKVRK